MARKGPPDKPLHFISSITVAFVASLVTGLVWLLLPKRMLHKVKTLASPYANLATDKDAPLRAVYLATIHGWNMTMAAATPEWNRKVAHPASIAFAPFFTVGTILRFVYEVFMSFVHLVVMLAMDVVSLSSNIASGINRMLWMRWELADAERNIANGHAKQMVLDKMRAMGSTSDTMETMDAMLAAMEDTIQTFKPTLNDNATPPDQT